MQFNNYVNWFSHLINRYAWSWQTISFYSGMVGLCIALVLVSFLQDKSAKEEVEHASYTFKELAGTMFT